MLAAAQGFITETFVKYLAFNNVGVSQTVYGTAVYMFAGETITNLSCVLTASGAALTTAQMAVYDANGNLLANTANATATFQGATGRITLPLTAPLVIPASGLYYLAVLSIGTTPPGLLGINQGFSGVGILKNGAVMQAGQAVLPNPAVFVLSTGIAYWFAPS